MSARDRRAVAALFAACGAAFGGWVPYIPIVAARLRLEESELGLALGLLALVAGATMPLAGERPIRDVARLGCGRRVAARAEKMCIRSRS